MENQFPLAGKTASTVRNYLSKKTNWFTLNFSNAFQQQKKALNKSTQFEINPKSLYTSRDEGFGENSVPFSQKKLLPFAGISAKIQENGINKQE